jgi:predicted thioredoxin/glutaredoxin
MVLTAYIHTTCPHSRELLALLDETGLRGSTVIIDAGNAPFDTFRHGILSVPSLFADNNMVISGAFDIERLRKYLNLYSPVIPDDETLFRGIINSATDNVGIAAYLYLYEEPGILFQNPDYLLATSGLIWIVVPDKGVFMEKLRTLTEFRLPGFLLEKTHLFHKVIALNFLREVYWMSGKMYDETILKQLYTPEAFVHWLMIRPAVGRIGIRTKSAPRILPSKARAVWDYMIGNLPELWPIVQKTI